MSTLQRRATRNLLQSRINSIRQTWDHPRYHTLNTCASATNNDPSDMTNNLTKSFYSQFAVCDQVSNTIAESSSPSKYTRTHDVGLLLRFLNSQQSNGLSHLPAGVTDQVDSLYANQVLVYSALCFFVDSINKTLAAIEQRREARREAREKQKVKELSIRQAIATRNERKKLKAKDRAEKILKALAEYSSGGRCELVWEKKIVRKHNPDADWGADDDEAFIQVEVDPLQVLIAEPELEAEYVIQRRISPLRQSCTLDSMIQGGHEEQEGEDGWGW